MSKVVILGGGLFGCLVAKNLSSDYQITIISPRDYCVLLPSTPRIVIEKDLTPFSEPLDQLFPASVTAIKDECLSFSNSAVTTRENGEVPFDVLILATGYHWPDPVDVGTGTRKDANDYYTWQYEKLENAKSIAIMGGGLTGCELAGEIACEFKQEILSGSKKITLIHASKKLLTAGEIPKLRQSVEQQLKKMGVELFLGQKTTVDDTGIVLESGDHLECDHVIKAFGGTANVPAHDTLEIEGDLCNPAGELIIKPTFQVEAVQEGNIFAVGDVTNYPFKTIAYMDKWVSIIKQNVQTQLAGGFNFEEVKWPTENDRVLRGVCLGRENGAGQYPTAFGTFYIPKFVLSRAKSRDMFAGYFDDWKV